MHTAYQWGVKKGFVIGRPGRSHKKGCMYGSVYSVEKKKIIYLWEKESWYSMKCCELQEIRQHIEFLGWKNSDENYEVLFGTLSMSNVNWGGTSSINWTLEISVCDTRAFQSMWRCEEDWIGTWRQELWVVKNCHWRGAGDHQRIHLSTFCFLPQLFAGLMWRSCWGVCPSHRFS